MTEKKASEQVKDDDDHLISDDHPVLQKIEENYPHDIHPGLVPGISVDEQRIKYGTDRLVFTLAAVLILGFIAWGVISTESLKSVSDAALSWVVQNTGWLFTSLVSLVLVFMIFLGFSNLE